MIVPDRSAESRTRMNIAAKRSMSASTLAFVGVSVISAIVGSCSSPVAGDAPDMKEVVLFDYPQASLGRAFDARFADGSWTAKETEAGGSMMVYQAVLDLAGASESTKDRWIGLARTFGGQGVESLECANRTEVSDANAESKIETLKAERAAEQTRHRFLRRQSVLDRIDDDTDLQSSDRNAKLQAVARLREESESLILGCLSRKRLTVKARFPINLRPDNTRQVKVGSIELDGVSVPTKSFLNIVFGV